MISLFKKICCFLIFCVLGMVELNGQIEICDNALDDDADGRIDLNDSDCSCEVLKLESLILNPSFEENTCCPNGPSEADCVQNWVTAFNTADYFHKCGHGGKSDAPIDIGFIDGDAAMGFIDNSYDDSQGYIEHIGSCLPMPLEVGVEYKLKFYFGFGYSAPSTDIALFGSPVCTFPSDNIDVNHGCPDDYREWEEIGQIEIEKSSKWIQVEIDFTPQKSYQAIIVGPTCSFKGKNIGGYYFIDNLILARKFVFDLTIEASGSICQDTTVLMLKNNDKLSYQWYKSGVALIGETKARLTQLYGEGDYQVMVVLPDGNCNLTEVYRVQKPETRVYEYETICKGQSFRFGNEEITAVGIYVDTLKTVENCDSLRILDLQIFENEADSVTAKIYPSEYYKLGNAKYAKEGIYTQTLSSSSGCDSTVILNLSYFNVFTPTVFSPNGDGVNDVFSILGGKEIVAISELQIYDRWGNLIFEDYELSPSNPNEGWNGMSQNQEAPQGVYLYVAKILFDDDNERIKSGSLTLLR